MPFADCKQHVRYEEAGQNEAAAVLHAAREAALLLGVCSSPSFPCSAAHVCGQQNLDCRLYSVGKLLRMPILTRFCLHQVPEQRVHTSVLPTHMAAPSAGASIVAFADTGFFRLLVVGLHSSNFITRFANTFARSTLPVTSVAALICLPIYGR